MRHNTSNASCWKMKTLLKCTDVAEWFDCSLSTVSRLVRSGALPCVRLNGGIRFDETQVEAWIASGGHQPARRRGRPRMVGAVATRSEKLSKPLNSQEGDRFSEPVGTHERPG